METLERFRCPPHWLVYRGQAVGFIQTCQRQQPNGTDPSCVLFCVFVYVSEKASERERERDSESKRETDTEREREREQKEREICQYRHKPCRTRAATEP